MFTNQYKTLLHREYFDAIIKGNYLAPVTIEIDPTNKCNNACVWCIDRKVRENTQELDWNKLKEFIASLNGSGVKSVVIKGGGEPLEYSHIDELLYALKDNGIEVGLITNGIDLDLHEAAVKSVCSWVRVSLSVSNSEDYNKFQRPVNLNAFNKVIDNIKSFSSALTLGVCVVINENSMVGVKETINALSILGINYIDIKIAHGIAKVVMDKSALQNIINQIEFCQAKYGPNVKIFYNRVDEKRKDKKLPYENCKAHLLIGIISADGKMYSCCTMKGNADYCIGSIYSKTIQDIWYGEKHKEIINKIRCGTCSNICCGRTSLARYDYYNEVIQYLSLQHCDLNFL